MNDKIQERLDEIEWGESVRILYACESGSRAWGFPSPDSDYDVRFIYIRPTIAYLTTAVNRRDIIERPIVDRLDVSGWDITKALQLFRKSNPPLMEWLGSPIVYRERGDFAAKLRTLADEHYSERAAAYHYFSMARGEWKKYLQGDTVIHKKYLYVLRPLFAVRWLEAGLGRVPTEFIQFFVNLPLDETLKWHIWNNLITPKLHGREMGDGPRLKLVDEFIEAEMSRIERDGFSAAPSRDGIKDTDGLFIDTLVETWGNEVKIWAK